MATKTPTRYCPMCERWVSSAVCLDCDTKTLTKATAARIPGLLIPGDKKPVDMLNRVQ